MNRFDRLPLAYQIAGVAAVLAALVIGALAYTSARFSAGSLERQSAVALQAQIDSTRRLIDTAYAISTESADRLANFFVGMFSGAWSVDVERAVKVGGVDAPTLRNGDSVLNLNFQPVDNFTRATGGVATVFARSGDDFVRVTTSLKKENGDRAIGTLLGKSHPAYADMISGNAYLGRARLFGRDYMTKYIPVRDAGGRVAAILFIGFDMTGIMESLSRSIASIRIGETGYAYVIATQGGDRGKFVFHPNLAGKDALSIRDGDGKEGFLAPLLQTTEGTLHYPWNDEAGRSRAKVVHYARTPSFGGWTVAGGTFVDEFSRDSRALGRVLGIAGACAALVLAALVAVFVSRRLRDLGRVADAMRRLGAGDLTAAPAHGAAAAGSRNELHRLAAEMQRATSGFRTLIADVRRQSAEVTRAAADMEHAAEALAGNARKQNDGALTMSSAVEEVGANVQAVKDSSLEARTLTGHASELSAAGAGALATAIESIAAAAAAVDASADTLARLEDQTKKVSGIAGIIAEIAGQTNLLALNAAIEAARAGEQGRGFAVVADEVRKLAERTTASTSEIGDMVANMRMVSDQVLANMREAVGHVKLGKEQAQSAGATIRTMASEAVGVATAVSEIATAMSEQAQASANIAGTVEAIALASEATAATSVDAARAARELTSIAAAMNQSIEPFRLDA